METKKILVMMSTYNGEKYLKAQIDSILEQQTDNDIILRIRDDGSKDSTCAIIREYIKKYPEKIELIEGDNVGYNASFFYLIQNAEGYDYYSISDQDDIWLENKLKVACEAIDNQNATTPILYASTSYLVHEDLKPYGKTREKYRELSMYNTLIQNICPGHTQVFNNEMLKLLKEPIDVSKIYVYDSWIANMANLYGKIIFDNDAYTYYRQYEGNQFGSGHGMIGQLLASVARARHKDGLKYRKQVEYFVEYNSKELSKKGFFGELRKLCESKSILSRMQYSIMGKMYRQRRIETISFYIMFLLGQF